MRTCTPGFTYVSEQMGTLQASYCAVQMLMSVHCRAQSQRNSGNGLFSLASM